MAWFEIDPMDRPQWLDEPEQKDVLQLLNSFIDRLDKMPANERVRPPAIKATPNQMPMLFVGGVEADLQWELIQSLSQRYGLITIRPNPKRNSLEPEYANARLTFQLASEDRLRDWLRRPHKTSSLKQWQAEVDHLADSFPGDTERLRSRQIHIKGVSPEQILQGFIKIGTYHDRLLTLRQLSANCFWGHSKFLDGREELVKALYPDLQLRLRPLVVNVHLPKKITGVLFIENQDSYTNAIEGIPKDASNYALIYCAGFKGGARRIRGRAGASLHFCGNGDLDCLQSFNDWWFAATERDWPIYFWGDLDYSGMAILKALKQRFSNVEAWKAGYAPMLHQLNNGSGHDFETANKQEQIDPKITGCNYADQILLPAIREMTAFVDQEFVTE